MAVSTPLSDAKLNAYDYSSPQVLEQQRAMNQAAQSGFQQGMQGVQNQSDARLKALLQGQAETDTLKKNTDLLNNLKTANQGAQVKVGDISVGVDPSVQLQAKMMKTTKDEYDNLDKHFQPQMKDLSTKSQQVEDALTGLNQHTKMGDQLAVTNITKMADGPATRLTMALLNKQTPSNIQGDAEKMANYWTGKAESGFSPADREVMENVIKAHAQNLNNSFQDAQSQFQTQAPHFAPTLAAGGQLASYTKDFGAAQSARLDRINKLTAGLGQPQQAAASTSQAPTSGLVEGMVNKARSLKDLLLGGSSPQSATASPPSPPQTGPAAGAPPPGQAMPTGPSGFDPDQFLGNK